ncbi:MAG: hypothetical protein D6800_00010 [Candidatus Zixiibacteriota bacterium]|nr:MAG: hypothetical protein D6800_00010 [candidate division Zixibacteria bacterium]
MSRRSRRSHRQRLGVRVAVVLTVALLLVAIRFVQEIGPEGKPGERFTVVRVIDGDTFELTGGDRVRLLAIDAPEEGEALHDSATALLRRLILGKQVRLSFARTRRDHYGRMLAYVFLDTLFVNRVLIDSGLAWVYLFRDNNLKRPEIASLLHSQQAAIKRQTGVWALPYEPEPYYVAVPGSFRLHRPGCRSIEHTPPDELIRYRTREEGLAAGLSPCRNCKP